MTTCPEPIVIVGAGHSGARAAAALRKHGWTGGISLIGAEHCPSTERVIGPVWETEKKPLGE